MSPLLHFSRYFCGLFSKYEGSSCFLVLRPRCSISLWRTASFRSRSQIVPNFARSQIDIERPCGPPGIYGLDLPLFLHGFDQSKEFSSFPLSCENRYRCCSPSALKRNGRQTHYLLVVRGTE